MPGPAMQKPATGKTTSPEQDFPSTFNLSPIESPESNDSHMKNITGMCPALGI